MRIRTRWHFAFYLWVAGIVDKRIVPSLIANINRLEAKLLAAEMRGDVLADPLIRRLMADRERLSLENVELGLQLRDRQGPTVRIVQESGARPFLGTLTDRTVQENA